MSLHIGMDKHGVRWKDRGNCWLFGQTKSGFRALQAKKEGCFPYILRKKVASCNKKEIMI